MTGENSRGQLRSRAGGARDRTRKAAAIVAFVILEAVGAGVSSPTWSFGAGYWVPPAVAGGMAFAIYKGGINAALVGIIVIAVAFFVGTCETLIYGV